MGFIFLGAFILFFVFMLSMMAAIKGHISRDKVLALEDLSELYSRMPPPKNVLTEEGKKQFFPGEMKNHISQKKVSDLTNLGDLYRFNEMPPREVLTDKGQKLYDWYRKVGLVAVISFWVVFFWVSD